MSVGTTQTVLFADPPVLCELCSISVSVNGILHNVPAVSRFQIQTIKCREIIFTEPDVIASPSLDLESVFIVIMQKSLYKTGRLQSRLQKLGLEVSKPSAVSPSQYQSCLRYTLLAKLAPNWNKAGQWLIQGRDFLTQSGYANAIKMDVAVTSNELYFSVDACTVRFPSLKIDDLDIPVSCYHNFLQNPIAVIHQHMIPMVWCHVLPSMKKGTIVSISHNLPKDGPFQSYKEIKRHWKNHYGYRLPEDEDGMLYYQINFRPLGDKLFTYPEVCLRARDIQRVPRVDPKPILITFLQDLQKRFPKICGQPLKLQSKACFPTMDLTEVSQVEKKPVQNLSSKMSSNKVIYRNSNEVQRLISNGNKVTQPIQSSCSSQMACPSIKHRDIIKETHFNEGSGAKPTNGNLDDCGTYSNFRKEQSTNKDIVKDRIVPVFKVSSIPSCTQIQQSNPSQKVVPIFKPRPHKALVMEPASKLNDDLKQNGESLVPKDCPSISQKVVNVPVFARKQTPIMPKQVFSQSKQTPKNKSVNINLATKSITSHPSTCSVKRAIVESNIPQTSRLNQSYSQQSVPCLYPSTPKSLSHMTATSNGFGTPASFNTSTPSSTPGHKRPNSACGDGTPCIKKPRNKQQIQDVDVEKLARNNQIKKINTATLVNWLKQRGVLCKSKDKKGDLVEQALKLLDLKTSEQ